MILRDPLIKRVLKDMRSTLCENLESSHWKEQEEREEIYKMLRTVKDFERRLTKYSENGRVAESTLDRMKRFVRIKERIRYGFCSRQPIWICRRQY